VSRAANPAAGEREPEPVEPSEPLNLLVQSSAIDLRAQPAATRLLQVSKSTSPLIGHAY
jgi:hypothetical protein